MQNANSPAALRRSSRVPINVPILVTSLEPGTRFSEVCETLVVNAHGCAMRSPVKLDAGVLLHFHSKEGRETTAKVINCQPLTSDRSAWQLAARLDRPENFWGLSSCPPDWAQLPAPAAPTNGKVPSKLAAKTVQPVDQGANAVSPSLKAMFDKIQKQVSDEHLRSMISELMHPFLGDMADLKEKLGRMATSLYVSESLCYYVSSMIDRGGVDYSVEGAATKVFNSEALWTAADEALQIAGKPIIGFRQGCHRAKDL